MSQHADLLFEIGTEELPPKALRSLSSALTREMVAGLDKAGLDHGQVHGFATPRRLGLLVEACSRRQDDREVERRGPAVTTAFDEDGLPTKAAEGFARSCGTQVAALDRLKTDKGEWLVFRVRESGRPAAEILPGIAEEALARLPIPKQMRWGALETQFVRPVHWLLFMHGEEVVPCRLMGVEAGRMTHGHRFHHPGAIWVADPSEYARALEDTGRVVPKFEDRRSRIASEVSQVAESLGGRADMDEALLDEVCALVEWPVAIAGSFEDRFLAVPNEALILTMKQHQKYFPLFDSEGRLMSHFITVANIDSPQPELIKEGNERVVRPRLTDAMFFWEQDGKQRLEDRVEALRNLVFQHNLGSMYDKSLRVAGLAGHIAAALGADQELAGRAGMLSRCDLMTEMVLEFPEMQGIMGRYQASRDGEPEELARAMDEFYMPRFSGDRLPETPTGLAIALADRLDTLVAIFGIGEKPTGDKDPFALRRAALGALRMLIERQLDLDLRDLLARASAALGDKVRTDAPTQVYGFMLERLRGYYVDKGIAADVLDAVAELRPSSPVDLDRRVKAVSTFRALPEAETLAAANKRIRNLLRKTEESYPEAPQRRLLSESAEVALADAIEAVRPKVDPLLGAREYELALRVLAGLRQPVDRFFEEVMVMCEDEGTRRNRLGLLASLEGLFLGVADISRLQWC
jgi:glycyl-tRNA synthetase beta chain